MIEYDAVIIGGGPAGSTAALHLNRLGFNVCVFEKKIFPRETLCGEFLSKEVTNSLKYLGLFESFLKLNPNPINKFKFYNNGSGPIKTDFEFPAYGIKRGVFDNFLLNEVKQNGITVYQPDCVKEIIKNNDKSFTIISEEEQSLPGIKCSKVIAAYGKQNILDKKLNRIFTGHKSFFNGVKFHLNESLINVLEKDTIHIFVLNGIYCGINYVGDKTVTVCFLENRRKFQNNPGDWINILMKSDNNFMRLFHNGISESIKINPIYGTGNIYFGKRELVKNGIYFIGDSSAVIAPLAGDGIGMAMQNAKLISEIFMRQKSIVFDNQKAEKYYMHEWKKLFGKRLQTAKIIQNILMNSFYGRIGYKIIRVFPCLIDKFIKVTRG